jgi:hypothetical protein
MSCNQCSRFRWSLPRLIVSLLLVLGSIAGAAPAWAWGDLGHKIVCQIAFQELNDKARAEVVRLIALDTSFDSFTDACTWPDHPRQRAEEHFINVPWTLQTINTTQCSRSCAVLRQEPAVFRATDTESSGFQAARAGSLCRTRFLDTALLLPCGGPVSRISAGSVALRLVRTELSSDGAPSRGSAGGFFKT